MNLRDLVQILEIKSQTNWKNQILELEILDHHLIPQEENIKNMKKKDEVMIHGEIMKDTKELSSKTNRI